MADYIFFAGGVPISVFESSDSDEELNVTGLNLEDEEPEVHFNDQNIESENLKTALEPKPEVSRKRPQDDAQDEEELIEGSGFFAKRTCISGCPDIKNWLLKNRAPTSLQDPDIRDHCVESLFFPPDVQRWTEYGKDDLPNAVLGHILEVTTFCFFAIAFPDYNCLKFNYFLSAGAGSTFLKG